MKSSSSQHLYHSLKLRGHAAEMRQRHNAAEVALWQQLMSSRTKMEGRPRGSDQVS
jgi:very-short-patch-repair endonuclease